MPENLFRQFAIDDCNSTRTFIIAELSANHGGSLETAVQTLHAATQAGADAVKIQTYTPDTITIDCDKPWFRIKQGTLWDGTNLYDLYRTAYTPWEWLPALKQAAKDAGVVLFSSPFDKSSVDYLAQHDMPAYKVASFEITDIPLIEYIAAQGKPVIISTGIACEDEIHEALAACRRQQNPHVALLKCTSAYPAPIEEANLRTLADMRSRFGVPVGISDHTLSSTVALTSVALGARIVEKHFILNRAIGGPDAAFSMEADEFRRMVATIRDVEKALGRVTYDLSPAVRRNRKFARSLFVVENLRAGDILTDKNVRSIRPADGLAPKYLPQVLGHRVNRDIERGEPLKMEYID